MTDAVTFYHSLDEQCFTRLLIAITSCDQIEYADAEDSIAKYTDLKQSVCEDLNSFIQSAEDHGDAAQNEAITINCPSTITSPAQKTQVATLPLANVIPVSARCEKQLQADAAAGKEPQMLANMVDDWVIKKRLSNFENLKEM